MTVSDPLDAAPLDAFAPELELPQFSGPLDLLLHLIRKNKLSIHDIPIVGSSVLARYFIVEPNSTIVPEAQAGPPRNGKKSRLTRLRAGRTTRESLGL